MLLGLSWLSAAHGEVVWVAALFDGVAPVVVAIVAAALWRMGRKTLTGWPALLLALGAFAGIRFLGVPFPVLVLGAGLLGLLAAAAGRNPFRLPDPSMTEPPATLAEQAGGRLLRLLAVFAVLFAAPVAGVLLVFGTEPFADVARLFTTTAFVTFGGAYAVLPYIAQAGVETYGWLTPEDMVRGLALAESTPGPTILVLQFVGFHAGWNAPGDWDPAVAGTVASLLALYVTFLPSFFFIFAGGPYVGWIVADRRAAAALAAITAAVVGVILNLALFLGAGVLVPGGRPDPLAVGLALVALVALVRFKVQVHWVVLAGAVAGLLRAVAGV